MSCLEASELMSLLLDQALDQEQEGALQQHLAACEHCRLEWQFLKQTDTLLTKAAVVSPPPAFSQAVAMAIRRRTAWRSAVRGGAKLFLVMLVVALLGLAPILGLSQWLTQLVGQPTLLAALIGVVGRLANIAGALARAMTLALQAALAGPNWFFAICYVLLVGFLLGLWMRLVTRAPDVRTERRIADGVR